jgi:hypothetical protein
MTTFANWIKAQEHRDDSVGYFARYWDAVTPGRISTPSGVERQLLKIEDATPEDAVKEQAAIGAALAGFKIAVGDYHKDQALSNAVASGVLSDRIPREEPPVAQEPDAVPEPQQAGEGTNEGTGGEQPPAAVSYPAPVTSGVSNASLVAQNFASLAQQLDRIEAHQRSLEKRVDSLGLLLTVVADQLEDRAPQPIDWDALFEGAAHE